MGESHEATERLANPKTLLFVSSGSLTSSHHVYAVSRRGSFEGRPSDILDLLGLDNLVTGCQSGSILEASPS